MTLRLRSLLLPLTLTTTLIGCGAPAAPGSRSSALADSGDPWAVSPAMAAWQEARMWGMHHLRWHTVRRWNLLDPQSLAYAEQQGWTPAAHQEGEPENGLEFLAMHRLMVERLRAAFPEEAARMLDAWATPPTDPNDPDNPLPFGSQTPFDSNMRAAIAAITRLVNTPGGEGLSDDDVGLFIETNFGDADPRSGIHNYLHERWSNPASAIDLGNPRVNLANHMFWRLHGWIDATWTAFRKAAGEDDATDQAYQAALAAAASEMDSTTTPGASDPDGAAIPWQLAHMFDAQ